MSPEGTPIATVNLGFEDAYFRQRDQEKIRALREQAAKELTETYTQAHRGHCFRCGTHSLVEVAQGKVKIDVCVNHGCGAVHLDPGELDALLADHTVVSRVRQAVLSCFR